MKGLMGRLVASYVLLALITLGGAGLLLETVLSEKLAEADQMELKTMLDGAARVAGMQLLFNPDRKPGQIEAELHKTYPFVQVEAAEPQPPAEGDRVYDVGAMPGLPAPSPASPANLVVSRRPEAPRERLVQVIENGQIRIALRLTWPDQALMRTRTLRQALLGAGLLALGAALAMALWFSRTLSAPLDRMAHAAGHLAEGRWDAPLPDGGPREIKQLSEAFRAMAARLEGDFRQLREDREKLQGLAAELAHELRTPIASLRTYHELLLDGEQEHPASRQELLERGAAQVARLEYLTQFLVDMARLRAHAAALNLQELDLRDLVIQASAAIQPVARQRGVRVTMTLPEEPAPVLADPQRVGQALDNLLQNAARWSPEDGEVEVAVLVAGDRARAWVADRGPGIPDDLLPRLFHPFVRGPGSGGLGLGLAIVQAVAQSHGGSVAAANRPEGGAAFSLELPLHMGIELGREHENA